MKHAVLEGTGPVRRASSGGDLVSTHKRVKCSNQTPGPAASLEGEQRKGFRLSASDMASGPERLRTSGVDQLAFDLVHTLICEPQVGSEFSSPDDNGIAWLSVRS